MMASSEQAVRCSHQSLQRGNANRPSPRVSRATVEQHPKRPDPRDDDSTASVMWLGRYPNSFVSQSHLFAVMQPLPYELSDGLRQKQIEILERKYGGRLRTHRAATIIQRAFRNFMLSKRWKQVRLQQSRRHKVPQWPAHRLPSNSSLSTYRQQMSPPPPNSLRGLVSPCMVRQSPRPPQVAVSSSCSNGSVSARALMADRAGGGHILTATRQVPVLHSQRSDTMLLCRGGQSVAATGVLNLHKYNNPVLCSSSSISQPPRTSLTAQLRAENSCHSLEAADCSQVHTARLLRPSTVSEGSLQHRANASNTASGGASLILSNEMEILRNGIRTEAKSVMSNGVGKNGQMIRNDSEASTPSSETEPPSYLTYAQLMSPKVRHKRIPQPPPPTDEFSSPLRDIWIHRTSAGDTRLPISGAGPSMLKSRQQHSSNSLPRLAKDLKRANSDVSTAVNRRDQPDDLTRRRQYRIALNYFNKKPERGMDFLMSRAFVEPNPHAVAKFLISRRGLSKQMIGEFLGNVQSPFSGAVLECFVSEIDLSGMEMDVALRHFLTWFRLPGEAQKIERIMQVFAGRYCECNAEVGPRFDDADTVFVLAFAIIMLNTDLHSPNVKEERRMKVQDFLKNLKGIDAGRDLDPNMLVGIYDRVKLQEFKPGTDHVSQVIKVDRSITGKDKPHLPLPHRRLVCYCRLHEVQDPSKKQAPNAHQREIFLFNDMLLVTKIQSRKKSNVVYSYRTSHTLVGVQVHSFSNSLYPHGLRLTHTLDNKMLLFNARNDDDRRKFAEDLREAIAESDEMEALRIELELEKQQAWQSSRGACGTLLGSRNETQRDSGLPDLADDATLTRQHRTLSNSLLELNDQSPTTPVFISNPAPVVHPNSHTNNGRVPRRASLNSLDSGMSSTASVESRETPAKHSVSGNS